MADTPAGAPTGDTPAAPAQATPAAEVTTTPAEVTTPAAEPKADPKAEPKAEPNAEPAGGDDPDPVAKEGDWASLREKIAKGDEKLAKRLARYSSVESVVEALIAAQAKISDGSLKAPLAKDATPEQVAAWREENGIPAEPTGYDLTMPDGLVIGEEDKPIVDDYVAHAHSLNLTPEQVKSNVAWYLGVQEAEAERLAEADLTAKEEGLQAITEAWGSETRLNKNLIMGLLNQAPGGEDTANLILQARLGDGTPLASSANVLRWLADVARTVNPTATVVPGAGANASQAIENELADLTKLMGDRSSEYWKGPKAEKMQSRYRDLINVQQKIG